MPHTELPHQIDTTSSNSMWRLDSEDEETTSPKQGFHQHVNKRKHNTCSLWMGFRKALCILIVLSFSYQWSLYFKRKKNSLNDFAHSNKLITLKVNELYSCTELDKYVSKQRQTKILWLGPWVFLSGHQAVQGELLLAGAGAWGRWGQGEGRYHCGRLKLLLGPQPLPVPLIDPM